MIGPNHKADYNKPGSQWTDADWKDLIANPQPPEDPTENDEFQEWVYFENGKLVVVRRPNPNYKPNQEASEPTGPQR